MSDTKNIIALVGPTACGKTAVSLELAKRMGGQIVSADSIQVYKGLDIGSAKPSLQERAGIVHHMLDVVDVADATFSVARFRSMALPSIQNIFSQGAIPFVVGGTGLYVNALTYPLGFFHVEGDAALRETLRAQEKEDPGCLYRQLQAVDALRASHLHPNDTKRVLRAIEIFTLTGKPPSSFGEDFQNPAGEALPYHPICVGLTMERAALYARIEARVDDMMRRGLLDEVRRYQAYDPALPALQGLGYKQLLQYLRDEVTLEEAVQRIKQETRRFAKRQWTWFGKDTRIAWFDVQAFRDLEALCDAICGHLGPLLH